MKLLFERSRPGRGSVLLPPCDVPEVTYDQALLRGQAPRLPEIAEVDLGRHYTELAKQTHGVNDGFYPLGSCTMKYNPRINEEAAAQPGFTQLHPLQPVETVQGALEVLYTAEQLLCEITGMDGMSFQPAAGAHGEYTGLLLIRKYHQSRGDSARTKILVPDAAHGTNPASATMAGFEVVSVPSTANGRVDVEALRALCVELAKKMASDGEGATHLITCTVTGAGSEQSAETVAKSVIGSALTKAAIFGADANWGRVLCAMGYSGAAFNTEEVTVEFASKAGTVTVCEKGRGLDFNEELAKEILDQEEVEINVTLQEGSGNVTCWGCDLTYDYVKINGDYRT